MRVITGVARGRKLKTLEGNDVRPTGARVKEGIFSSLQFQIEGRRVLDLFAGSGQMGIEALSRGAASAVFVDQSGAAIAVVKDNLKSTQLAQNAQVVQMDFEAFLLSTGQIFDVAFLDPPYGMGFLQKALPLLISRMSEGGTVVCECPEQEELPRSCGNFGLDRQYRYGKIKMAVYRRLADGKD